MKDVSFPLRSAYVSLLTGAITYDSAIVPVSESIEGIAVTADKYILLTTQDSTPQNSNTNFHTQEIMTIDIVSRGFRTSKETVDNIAGQILGLVCPTARTTGLISPAGIAIQDVYLESSRYIVFTDAKSAKNITRRILTFSQFVSH